MPDGSFNRAVTLASLATAPRWVAWQTEGRGAAGKPTKVPYAPGGAKAKADDPRTWGTRDAAETRAAALPKPFGAGGVGLELGDHDGLAIGGIDLDTCRTEAGDYTPWAREVLARFNTYAEVSPSGTGAKLFFLYDPADGPALRQTMGRDTGRKWCRRGQDHPPGIELYIAGRFFAATDERLQDAPEALRKVPLGDFEWLIREAGPAVAAERERAARNGRRKGASGDQSRSAMAFKVAVKVKRGEGTYAAFLEALEADPDTAAWKAEKADADGGRELRRAWEGAGKAVADDILLTEHGVALAFSHRYRDRLRYCHDTGAWFLWTGTHWKQDRKHAAFSFARDLVAAANRDSEFKTQAITGKAAFAGGVERFARADQCLAVTADAWNPKPGLLGTPGGTVDLRTGEMRAARPDDMITRTTAVAPAPPGTSCDRWLTFLDQATGRDDELIEFLKRWCGYCLTGLTREHALLFIYGPGGNGKSVFLNVVAGVLGDYHATAAMDTFTDGGSRHLAFLAMLAGARMVTAAETEEGRPWAETKIKEMTGGTPVTANFMRQDPFTFTPQFKITITGNHKPVLRNVDDAARRRFNIVPFLHKPAEPDRKLEDNLREERPGILRWMIDGSMAWRTHGLHKPKAVAEATDEYFAAQDAFGLWLAERCIVAPHLAERPGRLLSDFNGWAEGNGEAPANRIRFRGWAERQAGLRYQRREGRDYLTGIGFRAETGSTGRNGEHENP